MKRITRAKPDANGVKASDHWRTPVDLFAALHAEFKFDLDLAADETNHLRPNWLGPGGLEADALATSWAVHGFRGFLNPPYSTALINAFMEKAVNEEMLSGFTTVVLTPYTPDTKWWRHTAFASEIREIPHRVPYLRMDGATKAGAMFPSAVIVFRPQPGVIRGEPRRVVWTYRRP